MKKTVGEFEINVWEGGYPVWCHLKVGDKELMFGHESIADLEHAVRELKRAAWLALPEGRRAEVQLSGDL